MLLGVGPGLVRADQPDQPDEAIAKVAPNQPDQPDEAIASVAPTAVEPAGLRPRLTMDFAPHAWFTGGLLAAVGASQYWSENLAPSKCRWCEPPQVDVWARQQMLWADTKAAAGIGNVLVVAVPAATVLTLGLMGHSNGATSREVAEDVLLVAEAAAITTAIMQVSKFTTVRLRPDAWAGSGSTTANSRMSFFAGHSSTVFAMAASATQVARLRGYAGWKWIAAASFVGAAASGFFRIASDNHWLTDVIAGTAIGTGVGLAVPLLVLRPADPGKTGVTIVPSPGGLTLLF
jgi:hypothetical protein